MKCFVELYKVKVKNITSRGVSDTGIEASIIRVNVLEDKGQGIFFIFEQNLNIIIELNSQKRPLPSLYLTLTSICSSF